MVLKLLLNTQTIWMKKKLKNDNEELNPNKKRKILIAFNEVVNTAQLTGWVKPGEIWQLNIWIWML